MAFKLGSDYLKGNEWALISNLFSQRSKERLH